MRKERNITGAKQNSTCTCRADKQETEKESSRVQAFLVKVSRHEGKKLVIFMTGCVWNKVLASIMQLSWKAGPQI